MPFCPCRKPCHMDVIIASGFIRSDFIFKRGNMKKLTFIQLNTENTEDCEIF